MSKSTSRDYTTVLYDAALTRIDAVAGILEFVADGIIHTAHTVNLGWWTVGTVGRLQLGADSSRFSFYSYPDQRLRREPDRDDSVRKRWCWRVGDHRFTVKAGLVPGKNGDFVSQDTRPIRLEVPREFLDFCARRELKPTDVLRAYIADLCELYNWCRCPREDGYSSNGSDERRMARDYFHRAFGWVDVIDKTQS